MEMWPLKINKHTRWTDVCNQRTACTPHLSSGAEHERSSQRCRSPVLKGHDPTGFAEQPGGPGSGRFLPGGTDHPAGRHPLRTGFPHPARLVIRLFSELKSMFLSFSCVNYELFYTKIQFFTVFPYILYWYSRLCPPPHWVGAIIPCPPHRFLFPGDAKNCI